MNLRKFLLAVVAALTVSAAVVSSSLAITHGRPDGNAHPYVGLMVALDKDGVPLWRCSGSLLSPTVFLTAGRYRLRFAWASWRRWRGHPRAASPRGQCNGFATA
jgi:hypothetical protein